MRSEQENTALPKASQAPIKRVFLLVLFSITVVTTFSLLWHSLGMAKDRVAQEREAEDMSANIAKLTLYRDNLLATASTTGPVTPLAP